MLAYQYTFTRILIISTKHEKLRAFNEGSNPSHTSLEFNYSDHICVSLYLKDWSPVVRVTKRLGEEWRSNRNSF